MGEYTIDNPDTSPNAIQTQAQAFAVPAQAAVNFEDVTATAVGSLNTLRGDLNIVPGGPVAGFQANVTAGGSNISIGITVTPTGGWVAWSGTNDKTSHATFAPATASVAYDATQIQSILDELVIVTQAFKALLDANFAHKIVGL